MNEFCTWKFPQHFYNNVDLISKRVDRLEVDDKVVCLNSQHLYDNINLSHTGNNYYPLEYIVVQ